VTRRVPIRVRLAVAFALLAAVLLAAGMAVVYKVEQAEVRHTLESEAKTAAASAAAVVRAKTQQTVPGGPTGSTEGDGGDDGASGPGTGSSGSKPATKSKPLSDSEILRYLHGRQGGGELLLVTEKRGGPSLVNVPEAHALNSAKWPRLKGVRSVTVDGDPYVLASWPAGDREAFAALPMATVNAEVARLGQTALIVTGIGIVAAALLAWIMARRALRPLERIAERSARITSGDLSVRMGDSGARDEVAQVSAALDEMLDRLQAAFAAQKRFVQDASHELRTPITIARGHLEVALMEGRAANAHVRAAVELAVGELERMGRLVDSLLALARAENGGVGARSRIPAARLAELSLARSQPLAERDWRLDLAGSEAAEAAVVVDPDAVEQVLLNLLANAARHTAPGGSIQLAVRRVNGAVEFEVADDGEGIDPADLPTLFDRFTRADDARGRDSGGAGIGLAICRTIVEAHGGAIRADSRPGEGARFVVSLPAAPERTAG
jgi:signal transduction histidine kinase